MKEEKLVIPGIIPGRETTVSLSLGHGEATIGTGETGLADALVTLPKSRGQHGPDIRMNWFYCRRPKLPVDVGLAGSAKSSGVLFRTPAGSYLRAHSAVVAGRCPAGFKAEAGKSCRSMAGPWAGRIRTR